MKLIKVNSYYYLLSDDTTDTGGRFIMWLGETVEHFPKQATPQINKYTIVPNSIYSGKPADGYKLLVATSNESFKDNAALLDAKKIETLLNRTTFTKEDLFVFVGFFNEKKKQGIDGEQIFKEFQQIGSDKTEWDVEVEMEKSNYVVSGGLRPMDEIGGKGLETHWSYKIKVNEQGFVNIKSVK